MNWQTSCIRQSKQPVRCSWLVSLVVIPALFSLHLDQKGDLKTDRATLKARLESGQSEVSSQRHPDFTTNTVSEPLQQPGDDDEPLGSSHSITPASGTQMALNPRRLRLAEADVPSTALALNSEDLGNLKQGDTLILMLPTGVPATLTVHTIRQTMGMRRLRLTDGELTSTLTLRGKHFFGTVASRSGTFSLEGTELGSRLWSQRELNYRWSAARQDYRHVPLG